MQMLGAPAFRTGAQTESGEAGSLLWYSDVIACFVKKLTRTYLRHVTRVHQ